MNRHMKIIAVIVVGLWAVGSVASANQEAPYIAADGREVPGMLPEFFHLAVAGIGRPADVTCSDGRPARIPSDDRYLSEIPIITADDRRFPSPWHFQRDY